MHVRKLFLLFLFGLAWSTALAAAALQLALLRDTAFLLGLLTLALAAFLPAPSKQAAAEAEDAPTTFTPVDAADAFDDLPEFEIIEAPRETPVVLAPAPLAAPAAGRAPLVTVRPELPPEKAAKPEWARPLAVSTPRGAAFEAVTRGKCGGCGARISLSTRRPLRATCPQCGRSRLLTR